MADKKITDLQLRGSVTSDLNFPSDDGIQSYRITAAMLRAFVMPILKADLAVGAIARMLLPSVQTGTYAILTTDDLVQCNAAGGAFTVTLPTAVSVSGKVYIIKKIDSSANVVTIATTSSQTIDGVVGSALHTQNECLTLVSDGANWQVVDRKIPSVWKSWTPTGSLTTNVTYTGMKRRVGDSCEYKIKIAFNGSNTQGQVTCNIDQTIDTAKLLGTTGGLDILGQSVIYDAAGGSGAQRLVGDVIYFGSTAVKPQGFMVSNTENHYLRDILTSAVQPITFAVNDVILLSFKVPIVGWNE